jgi:hypothetical protein
MVTYRYIHARTAPTVTCRLVPLAGVRDAVPAATPVVDGGARRRQIATRRAHIARRFRQ